MTNIEILVAQVPGLQRQDLERWIHNEWVRPDETRGVYTFCEIDVARVRLIRDLRDEMEVNEAALPVVLLLLDQIYELRRRMQEIGVAIDKTVTGDALRDLVEHLATCRS